MSTQVSNQIGDFSKAAISAYSGSLETILNLFYQQALFQNNNYEMEKLAADAEGSAAKGLGQTQQEVGEKEADVINQQAVGTLASAGTQVVGAVASAPASRIMAKSNLLSVHGEEIGKIDTKMNNVQSYRLTAEPKLVNGSVPLPEGVLTAKDMDARVANLSSVRIEEECTPAIKEDLEYASVHKKDDFNAFQKRLDEKSGELEKSKTQYTQQNAYAAHTTMSAIMQGVSSACKGGFDASSASSRRDQAEQQNLQALMEYTNRRLGSVQDALDKVNSNVESQKQNLAQILKEMGEISFRG